MANGFILAFIMAVVQAITEWVPVSSSGHLVLFSHILNYDVGLGFSIAVHFGTLLAVVVYFWKDLWAIVGDFVRLKFDSENGRLGLYLIVATIPAGIIGLLFKKFFESTFSNLGGVAIGFGITGLLLLIGSIDFNVKKGKQEVGFWRALIIGCFQVISIFPGISRSGSTMSSGMLFGLKEKNALKFAFLMSIPIILGANLIGMNGEILRAEVLWAIFVSFIIGIMTIHVLFKYLLTKKKNLRWFAIYVLVLALGTGIYYLI